jgi:hypothetical protein
MQFLRRDLKLAVQKSVKLAQALGLCRWHGTATWTSERHQFFNRSSLITPPPAIRMEAESIQSTSEASTRGRGRGRGRSRGGLGKYLRARGRGHRGGGRPAVFRERLGLEGELDEELDEEAAAELAQRFSRRQLGTNTDRYKEPSPELGSDGARARCRVFWERSYDLRRQARRSSSQRSI